MSAFFTRLCTRVLGMTTELRPVVNRYTAADQRTDQSAAGYLSPRRQAETFAILEDSDSHRTSLPQDVRHFVPVENAADLREDVARDAEHADERAVGAAPGDERIVNGPRRAALDRPERENEMPKPESPHDRRRLMPPASISRPGMQQNIVFATELQQKQANSSTVHVHIGRIDVRAVSAAPEKKAPSRATMRLPSLEAHLRARDRGSG